MKRILLLFVILAFTFTLFCACDKNAPSDETTVTETAADAAEYPLSDGDGLLFTQPFAYAGPYVEDGSDDEVGNVAAIRVKNDSDRAVRYATFIVQTDGGELRFVCTTLLPGSAALLLEQDRTPYRGEKAALVKTEERADFEEAPSLLPEYFTLSVKNDTLTVQNVSGLPVQADLYVYYKKKDAEGYVGGITYRVRFSGLGVDATLSQASSHLSETDCELLFVEMKQAS